MSFIKCLFIAFALLLFSGSYNSGNEIHVSVDGNDYNSGTIDSPLLTISKAAEVAKPGQTIYIHEGTYREYINPPRGGISNEERITFSSYKNDSVFIKGSEVINEWKLLENSIWKVELDISFFNGYNPFTLFVDGDYQNYGQWHHRGDVYINNSALDEQGNFDNLSDTPFSWYTETIDSITTIYGNFGDFNPNIELTEINTRELIFFARDSNVDFITINGIRFLHAAPNWQAPNEGDGDYNRLLQVGAVGSNMGKSWIIENSEIAHSKTAGIMFGENARSESSFKDISKFGGHIIRNNIIHKNGQYGIAGQKGLSRSEISGNRIQDINYRNEFGGYEPGGIKIWNSSDVLIENNFIHKVIANQSSKSQAYCIWIDFANQGTRITRNILVGGENTTTALFLEANVGPTLVDNNVIIDKNDGAIMVYSGGSIIAHNLFIDSNFDFKIQEFGNNGSGARRAYTLEPHSTIKTNNGIPVEIEYNKMFNNIFAGANGPINFGTSNGIGNEVKSNLYLAGARPNNEHINATVSDFDIDYGINITDSKVEITFKMDSSFNGISSSLVDAQLIGIIPNTGQSIANKYGIPIIVNTDINKSKRSSTNPLVGPLESLQAGINSISLDTKVSPTPSITFNKPNFINGN